MVPLRCCSSVNETLKSGLKSPPNEDAQGNVHPIRRLYACSFASGARDTAESVTSWFARCKRRSEEHTSELQSHSDLVCRLLLEKKKDARRFQPLRTYPNRR